MTSVASQWIEEVTAHARSDSLEDAREMCADGTYFPNNLRTYIQNMKLVTAKFKSGGLHEKHVVATWNVGNHLSASAYRHRETKKILCSGGRLQDLPNTDF